MAALQDLRDRPFELLVELERRGYAATASPGTPQDGGELWVGVAVRLADQTYLVAREEVREVLPVPSPLTRIPGARRWIRGITAVRGQILPVIDLRDYLGGGPTPDARSLRVVVAVHREVPAALLVDAVLGFRRYNDADFSVEVPATTLSNARYLAGSFRHSGQSSPVFSLRNLLEDPLFLTGAA